MEDTEKNEFDMYFYPDLIFRDVDWRDRTELFDEISKVLEKKGFVYSDFHRAIVEREREYPTGIQTKSIGVAIPHTDQEHIKKAFISIVRPKQPIEFLAMGDSSNGPVQAKLIFVLGVKKDGSQVIVLQKLMEIFSDENIIQKLLQAQNNQEVYDILRDSFIIQPGN